MLQAAVAKFYQNLSKNNVDKRVPDSKLKDNAAKIEQHAFKKCFDTESYYQHLKMGYEHVLEQQRQIAAQHRAASGGGEAAAGPAVDATAPPQPLGFPQRPGGVGSGTAPSMQSTSPPGVDPVGAAGGGGGGRDGGAGGGGVEVASAKGETPPPLAP